MQVVEGYERCRVIEAAQTILGLGGWCVLEACVDVPAQRWEARVLIFGVVADAVADAVEEELGLEPERDARLTGCDRRTLHPVPEMGEYLCYLAENPAAPLAR
jgi:hypothetical protein